MLVSDPRFIQFAFGSCYDCQYNESVHRKEQHTGGINTIPQKNIDLRLRSERVYSIFAGWQQLVTNKLVTIHSPDGRTPRYAHRQHSSPTVP